MNDTKFTPGPLLVCEAYADNGALSHYELRREGTGELVVEVGDPDAMINNTFDIELANVTLYAAAPEMYETLENLKKCLEGYFGKTEKDFYDDCDDEDSHELYFAKEYNAVCRVLKKARGEK